MVTVHWVHLVALLFIGICIAALTPWCMCKLQRFFETDTGSKLLFVLLCAAILIGGWCIGWYGTTVALACTTLVALIVNFKALATVVHAEGRSIGPGGELLTLAALVVNVFTGVVWVLAMVRVLTGGLSPITWNTFFR